MPQKPSLPIDARLPEVLACVRAGRNLVLVAEPGAGKTTRVPPALMEALPGEVIVLEPRRLATRLAARRVAEELGEEPGRRVGYQVRFERVVSKETRLRFVTEGVLVRELAARPELEGVSAVVLDELHERHLPGDVAFALVRELQRTRRPDVRIVAMSATLDAARVAALLDADVMEVAGRPYEVAIEHAAAPSQNRLDAQVAAAVTRLVSRGLDGDVLVFLPGAGEIRAAEDACAAVAKQHDLEVVPLHGDLPGDAQDRAVRPSKRRKVILATNVAESSITVPSVVAVVDSGLVRVATHSPWSGMPRLVTEKACRASLTQRAGRAGRVRSGTCVRLYTKADHDARPLHDAPEILRADLAETVLALRALGVGDVASLPWLDAPGDAQVKAADELLAALGATDAGGVTAEGRAMLRMPVHPRAAKLARTAAARGAGARGALLAALIGERDPLLAARFGGHGGGRGAMPESDTSDLLARASLIEAVEAQGGATPGRCRAHELDFGATQAVLRARDQLARTMDVGKEPHASMDDEDDALRLATLAAFPDRLAKRRGHAGSNEVVFAKGGAAKLAESCVVRDAELLVAVDAGEQRTHVVVRLASAVEPEMLLELFEKDVLEHDETRFDPRTERVVTSRGLAYRGLVLDATERSDLRGPAVSACLAAAARDAGLAKFVDVHALAPLRERAAFAALHGGPALALDDAAVWAVIDAAAEGALSFAELRDARPLELLLAGLPAGARAAVDRLAPTSLVLPGGRRVTVEYAADRPPSIGSRLQDFYGLAAGPRVADGRVPVVLHLHAPNGRDVQVTTDLAGFWQRHYPAIRKELMRKYPRHAWAEDPLHATPPVPGRRR